ncbi:MAG: hypothetical protein AB1453_02730 [Chloroflexota bacterium]
MSAEAYWFTAATFNPQDSLSAALKSNAIQPAWIDEIHWFIRDSLPPPRHQPPPDIFFWSASANPRRILHFILSDLLSGSRETVLMVASESETQTRFALLGSPRTVGRYNLPPHYRLAGLPAPNASGWNAALLAWRSRLELRQAVDTPPLWLCLPPAAESAAAQIFPETRRIAAETGGGILLQLQHLLEIIHHQPAGWGLWIEDSAPSLATWIEKI